MAELGFNASLLPQMRAIDFVNRLVEEHAVADPCCRSVRVHRIDGGAGPARAAAAGLAAPGLRAWLARQLRQAPH